MVRICTSARSKPSLSRETLGALLVASVACSFACNSALARVAYDAGSNTITVITLRTCTALLALLVLLWIKGVPLRLNGAKRRGALALGIVVAIYSYGLLGSIAYVPLAVALVTFYTFPLITALASSALGADKLSPMSLAALIVALVGMTLVLDVGAFSLDMRGIGLALLAACGMSLLLLLSDRVRGGDDSRPVTLHMLCTAALLYLVTGSLGGWFAFPQTTIGWIAFFGCPIFFSYSFITLFSAMAMTGLVRGSLIMNLEPIVSAVLGFLFLGQSLDGWQIIGIATVISGLILSRIPSLVRGGDIASDWASSLAIGGGLALLITALRLSFPQF